jgi:protein-disulfide isomerase
MPIDQLHPQARAVHEAARCAGDQDRFWEYRERAFAEAPIPLGRLADIAEDVGLDIAAFETCRAGPEVRRAVADGVQLASRLGLTSTPTFFINNRLVVGARPFDEFIPFIEEELRRARVPFD